MFNMTLRVESNKHDVPHLYYIKLKTIFVSREVRSNM